MSFLERVVAERLADARALPRLVELSEAPSVRSLSAAIERRNASGHVAVIAELKRRSPAAGVLLGRADESSFVQAYSTTAAAAISVLTEPRHWGGSLDDLRRMRAATAQPILCKDVIVHEAQLEHARAAGADAVLLIAEALDDKRLEALLGYTRELGMEALVEAHDPVAFGRAVSSGARIVGANARDLRDPSVIDRGRARLLHTFVRSDQLFVAESGIAAEEDMLALPARVDAVLVGSALMQAQDPAALLRRLAAVRRASAVGR